MCEEPRPAHRRGICEVVAQTPGVAVCGFPKEKGRKPASFRERARIHPRRPTRGFVKGHAFILWTGFCERAQVS